jgi:uncharacterized membrane protein YozB (DUF420 family)
MNKTFSNSNNENETDPNIAELAADYVETYYKLTVVTINQKIADITAVASFSMIAALVASFTAIFLCIAAALWIGSAVGSLAGGFLLVSLFCFIVFLVLFLTRKKLFYPFIKNRVIKSIYE